MLRFIKGNLTSIDGVEIFPIISLLIFVIFFTGLIIYTIKMDKKHIEEMSGTPLEEDTSYKNSGL